MKIAFIILLQKNRNVIKRGCYSFYSSILLGSFSPRIICFNRIIKKQEPRPTKIPYLTSRRYVSKSTMIDFHDFGLNIMCFLYFWKCQKCVLWVARLPQSLKSTFFNLFLMERPWVWRGQRSEGKISKNDSFSTR